MCNCLLIEVYAQISTLAVVRRQKAITTADTPGKRRAIIDEVLTHNSANIRTRFILFFKMLVLTTQALIATS